MNTKNGATRHAATADVAKLESAHGRHVTYGTDEWQHENAKEMLKWQHENAKEMLMEGQHENKRKKLTEWQHENAKEMLTEGQHENKRKS